MMCPRSRHGRRQNSNTATPKTSHQHHEQHDQPTRAGNLKLRSGPPPQHRARSALSRCSSGPALAVSSFINLVLQTTESLRQRSDIGRGRCDSKAAPSPHRWAGVGQTNCPSVTFDSPSFFMSTSVKHLYPCPSVKFRVEICGECAFVSILQSRFQYGMVA